MNNHFKTTMPASTVLESEAIQLKQFFIFFPISSYNCFFCSTNRNPSHPNQKMVVTEPEPRDMTQDDLHSIHIEYCVS